jgi:hypothetical protein
MGVLICLQAAQGGVRRARHAILAVGDAIGDVTAERWKADLAYGSANFGFRCIADAPNPVWGGCMAASYRLQQIGYSHRAAAWPNGISATVSTYFPVRFRIDRIPKSVDDNWLLSL